MEKIAVIGAGMMGPGIAQIFAAHGHPVQVHDTAGERLATVEERVRANLERLAEYDLADADGIPETLGRISVTQNLEEACAGAGVVVEAITEDLKLKQDLFAELDRLCPPETILCSNTSVMSITEIGSRAKRRERILGTHYYQPPFLVPLVEVVQTQYTAPECMDKIYAMLCAVGKVPVRVLKDVPGFIANRMQHALWREAFALIDEGVCDPETIDIAVKNSFGLRLPVLGPVMAADMVGLDLTLAIHDYVLKHLNASPTPSSTLREHVAKGEFGFKTGRGFLKWDEESIRAAREQLTTYLLETLSRRRAQGNTADHKSEGKQS
ncbi:MAG TPA: 3-hydroxyacyl-CoA dehydrogenase family protein [Bryobacteraceae bacterium]|nr:3-hydroxyacyl-CoA dehydrogenase family protein [Bryobacteraceae bacterium]HPU73817.1 3-hydroxyacyl-CoA dehydrogenase family protein [Bryobacteraceae bacterium]